MKRIRGGSGLGDAIYQRPIAEHFLRTGEEVEVCTVQAGVFSGCAVKVSPFRRENIDVLAHYTTGKTNPETTQWQDICKSAGVPKDLPLRFEWKIKNQVLIDEVLAKAAGRPVVIVHGGRAPMARTDAFGSELLPKKSAFDAVISALGGCFLVKIGKGPESYALRADLDLSGKTSVSDLFDIAWICKGIVGQCSFIVPLAECFDKPLLAIWAAHGMEATRHQYIKTITPRKILSKKTSTFVVDDWSAEKIQEYARAFSQF